MTGKKRQPELGMTLPLVAVFIVVLFAFAALAIDLGILYTARTSAQHAADAGALAGAGVFAYSANPSVAAVGNVAVATAIQNKILGQTLSAADFGTATAGPCPPTSTTTGVCVDTTNRRVTVYIARTGATAIGTFFARAIGWKSVAVNTRATAEASPVAGGTHCLKPFFIPNTVVADPGDTIQTACSAGHVLFQNQQLTDWAKGKLGTQFVMRPVNPNDTTTPSQYMSLDFGAGGRTYRCTISHCLNDPTCDVNTAVMQNFSGHCGQSLTTQNGVDTGKTFTGVEDLIGNPADGWWEQNSAPGPFSYCPGDPAGDCAQPNDFSKSLITAAVYDDCPPNAPVPPGAKPVNFVGFMEVFVNSIDNAKNADITAHFVTANDCGTGPPVNGGTGPGGVPVRLIQAP